METCGSGASNEEIKGNKNKDLKCKVPRTEMLRGSNFALNFKRPFLNVTSNDNCF